MKGKGRSMKRKGILRKLLITLAVLISVLIVAGVVWFVWLFLYWGPRALEAQDKMILTVRYIGLGMPNEFYDEVMNMPDGYIRASDLKTKLPEDASEATWGMIRRGMIRQKYYFPRFPGFLYVKKEGRFLCVAVTTFPPERNFLYPGHGWRAERFEWIPDEVDPHVTEEDRQKSVRAGIIPEDRRIIWTEDWDIDPHELLSHGIRFD